MLLGVSLSINARHFITNTSYRQKVDSAFNAKMKLIGISFYDVKELNATQEEQEALKL